MSKLQASFEKAAADIKKLAERPDNDTLLKLYALYQAVRLTISPTRR